MAKAWLMILWGLYTFQGKYIVNLEIKQVEVQEKPRQFNRPHSLGVMMRGGKSALRKSIHVFL